MWALDTAILMKLSGAIFIQLVVCMRKGYILINNAVVLVFMLFSQMNYLLVFE